MNKEYIFNSPTKGGKTKIIISDGTLTISRPGIVSKFSHGFVGDKTILINNISAVQLKKAGFARGYIQCILPGTTEKKVGIVNGSIDENIIYFDAGFNKDEINANAEEIKLYIENYNSSNTKNTSETQVQKNKYDELKQIKELLDDGVINQEEFEKEKEKILK